jgi:hypothetical protein
MFNRINAANGGDKPAGRMQSQSTLKQRKPMQVINISGKEFTTIASMKEFAVKHGMNIEGLKLKADWIVAIESYMEVQGEVIAAAVDAKSIATEFVIIHSDAQGCVCVTPHQMIEVVGTFEGTPEIAAIIAKYAKRGQFRLGMARKQLDLVAASSALEAGEILEILLRAKTIRLVKESILIDRTEDGSPCLIQTIAMG